MVRASIVVSTGPWRRRLALPRRGVAGPRRHTAVRVPAGGVHLHLDLEPDLPAAVEDAPGRRDVPVVAARGDSNLPAPAGEALVGGVEADPAEPRQPALDPGVGGVAGPLEVAGDIAGGDAPGADDGDHEVGVVLADPAPRLQDVLDGGLRRGASRDVLQAAEEGVGEPRQAPERVAAGLDAMARDECVETRRGLHEGARAREAPVGKGALCGADLRPGAVPQAFRKGGGRGRLDGGAGPDLEGLVLAVKVEEMPGVAEAVRLAVEGSRRARLDLELEEPLAAVLERLEAEQHDALPHAAVIAVAGEVLDLVADGPGHRSQRTGESSTA